MHRISVSRAVPLVMLAALSACHNEGESASEPSSQPSSSGGPPLSSGAVGNEPGTTPVAFNEPTSVQLNVGQSRIFVKGVGQSETTTLTIKLVDSAGKPVFDAASGVNNVRVALVSRPYGGEVMWGVQAGGTVASTSGNSNAIDVRTTNGEAVVTVQAGSLPGSLEIQVEAFNHSGTAVAPAVTAKLPQIVIASGPPHTIVFSTPDEKDGVQDLEGGFYRQVGAVTVTDRFGNAVPDGTVVHLGVVDSVISRGIAGVTTAGNSTFHDATVAPFTTASVYRNQNYRFIEPGDRLLVTGLLSGAGLNTGDRSRHVAATPTSDGSVDVTKPFYADQTTASYLVGASLLGVSIAGVDEVAKELTPGEAITKNGYAVFYMTYPSDWKHIGVGCGFVPFVDLRHTKPPFTIPDRSADVYIVASAGDSPATAAISDPGEFCFEPVGPGTIVATPAEIQTTTDVEIQLEDSGDLVALTYAAVFSRVNITNRGTYDNDNNPATPEVASQFNVTAADCFPPAGKEQDPTQPGFDSRYLTDPRSGICVARVTVTGPAAKDDSADVFFRNGKLETKISVKINVPIL